MLAHTALSTEIILITDDKAKSFFKLFIHIQNILFVIAYLTHW